jgi:hypothetical protein
MVRNIVVVAVLAASSVAQASDGKEEEFMPLDRFGQLGFGASLRNDPFLDVNRFDGSFRIGHVRRVANRIYPGGFFELHTVGFDTYDAAFGPQVQLRLGNEAAVQLRGGVGAGTEGTHATVGGQIGMWFIAGGVTARRSFDTHETVVSVNLELTAVLPLIPIAIAAFRSQ